MGSTSSIPKAQERVRQLQANVEKFNGTMASKRYKKLQMKLVKTNEKVLKLQDKTQKNEECGKMLRDLSECLQKLTDKVTAPSLPKLVQQFTLSTDSLNYDRLEQIEDNRANINPPIVKPKTSKEEEKSKPVLPPVLKQGELPADYKKIYPPLPSAEEYNVSVSNRTRGNDDEIRVSPPIPKNSEDNNKPLRIHPPILKT